jgi:hypothetical protein
MQGPEFKPKINDKIGPSLFYEASITLMLKSDQDSTKKKRLKKHLSGNIGLKILNILTNSMQNYSVICILGQKPDYQIPTHQIGPLDPKKAHRSNDKKGF